MKSIVKIFIICCTLFVNVSLEAQYANIKVQKRPTNPVMAVNDFANMLNPFQRDALETKIRKFFDSTSIEIIILTLNSLDGFEVEDVAYAYGKAWKTGNKDKDNGIIVLVSKEPRKVRIEPGKGMEGAVPDGLAGSIIRNEMIPFLKQGNTHQAFDNAVSAIIAASRNEYKMDNPSDRLDQQSGGMGYVGLLILLVFLLVFIFIIIKSKGGGPNGGMLSRRGYRRWDGPTVIDYGPWSGGSGGGIFGGGSSSGGGGWGDFGSSGGGDFGGGGASGDW